VDEGDTRPHIADAPELGLSEEVFTSSSEPELEAEAEDLGEAEAVEDLGEAEGELA